MPSRFVIILLLIFQGALTAYGASPWMSAHCGCTHGVEVPCDCPHHGDGNADDASLPPCHRAMKSAKPKPKPVSSSAPVFKNRCGGNGPVLVLLSLVPTPEPSIAVHWAQLPLSLPIRVWAQPALIADPPTVPPPRMSA